MKLLLAALAILCFLGTNSFAIFYGQSCGSLNSFNIVDDPKKTQDEVQILRYLHSVFLEALRTVGLEEAREKTLKEAQKHSFIRSVALEGSNLAVIFQNGVRGVERLDDPTKTCD